MLSAEALSRKAARPEVITFATVLAAGAWARPRTLPDFDAGEFLALAAHGGIAHPPGYPLWTLLLRCASGLVGTSPGSLSMLSVLLVAAAAVVLCAGLRRLEVSPFASVISPVVVCTAAPVWRAATNVEPFALHLLLTSIVLVGTVLLAEDGRARTKGAVLAGVGLGLGVAHHHSLAFTVPVVLWFLLQGQVGRAARLGWFCAAACAGALPVLLLLVGPLETQLVWGDWQHDKIERFFTHVLRREYGTFSLAPGRTTVWLAAPAYFFTTLITSLSAVFALVGAFGFRPAALTGVHRRVVLGSAGLIFLSGPLFAALTRVGSTAFEVDLLARFFAMPLLLTAPLIAFGVDELLVLGAQKRAVVAALTLSALLHAAAQSRMADRSRETLYEGHVRAIFAATEPDSLIATWDDAEAFGLPWARDVAGLGPRHLITLGLLPLDWYRARLAPVLGEDALLGPTSFSNSLFVLSRRQPVYLLNHPSPPVESLLTRTYPIGPLLRVGAERPPPVAELFDQSLRLLDRLGLSERDHLTGWERSLLQPWTRTFQMIAPGLEAEGDMVRAQRAREIAVELERREGAED